MREFRILGPLEVVDGHRRLPLRGANRRAALGYLLLNPNRVVATGELVTALWPHGAPPTARKMLHNAVCGLRATLGEGGAAPESRPPGAVLLSRPPGYVLRLDADGLDLARFRRLAGAGRSALAAGAWARAAALLGQALELWRGAALADLAEAGIAWPELRGLEGERTAALEDRFEAELALGRHHEVVAELEAEARRDPARERLASLLALALYRCGRQVAALEFFRLHRAALREELGLEPGRALRELERAILNHHPSLGPPPGGPRPRDGPELELLHSVLRVARRERRPYLVTVLGPAGTGKSRLLARLSETIDRDERSYVDVFEDIHRAGEAVLESIGRTAEMSGPARLIIATARPELIEQRPDWGSGRNHLTITLDRFEPDYSAAF
ncbi:BTAD domain-containing putative transcriptional regulator [Kitasatospora sp. NPDC051170]|uniref:AfsR/SARP family transcriptional regulator n=1 Tax=Kitasatospora sp. NPDC051170 TaxID=3364056 RepID=UPI0037B92EEB